jgi:serine/threonine-protein kinase
MQIKKTIPDWLIGVVLTVLFMSSVYMEAFNTLELKTFDWRARLAASQTKNPDIEIVAITEEDIAELGRFPWPRNILAQVIHNLSQAGAKVIAPGILLTEPEESTGLKTVNKLKEKYEELGLGQEGPGLVFYKQLSDAVIDLDNDAKLYKAMKEAGNVVLPVFFDEQSKGRDTQAPDYMKKHAIKIKVLNTSENPDALHSVEWKSKIVPLLPNFAETAVAIGHFNLRPDKDGYIRYQDYVIGYLDDIYCPSYAVAIVKVFKGLKDEDIILNLGKGLDLKLGNAGVLHIPAESDKMRTLINWNQGPDVVFQQTSFAKVYSNQFESRLFNGKIVLIGATAAGIGDRFVTPISGNLPSVEIYANAVSNVLHQKFFTRPAWTFVFELGILLLFGAYISLGLPRLKAGLGALTTLGLFIVYAVTGFIFFFYNSIWLQITPALLLLALGYILVVSKHFFMTEKVKEKVEADSVETNKMLGLSFQQQGMLDLAFEKFRKLPLAEEGVKNLLYNLGLDFERKRQFSKALAAYKTIIADGKNFEDLDERIPKLKGAEASMIFGKSGGHPGDIGATLVDTDAKPTLGRYEVVGELGRGAMGVVYKGVDPKIHRTVAIKTIRLNDFDDDVLSDMKTRFFREAESAGLLNHPNIVTIYDCGEEHDLAYIAMELLEGNDLSQYVYKANLLPMREVLFVIAQVAEALDYAHAKGIVHRDIKPANIMRLKGTNEIKVTDFGIARITSSSRTKTGVVLGTPSYMSPEQIAGKRVDGRSDIFSLGVVLFELLSGEKPFNGEDITSLMYQIASGPHVPVRKYNPNVPSIVDKIIDKALAKDEDDRYQKAGLMGDHLRKVVAKIDELKKAKM